MAQLSCLLCETVQWTTSDHILVLNSAADPFVSWLTKRQRSQETSEGMILLAEDNIASVTSYTNASTAGVQHMAFHEYNLQQPPATMDIAVMNLLYQPGNAWIFHGLHMAFYALRPGGYCYVAGAKDRGILSIAKRLQEYFGNVETVTISKGHRVLRARKDATVPSAELSSPAKALVFADGKLDEATRLLLEVMEVRVTDEALDLGCGAGFIGLHIARLAAKGQVTMVDTSLVAVATAWQEIIRSGLTNVQALVSDGTQAVQSQHFDLVATNPPFHLGGIHTTSIAVRFMHEAAQVLRPQGRFYVVANRFLKYEPTLKACFKCVEEVGGDNRYKVLCSSGLL